jgi:hypothetical protein
VKEEATSNSEITDFLKEFGEEMEIVIEASPSYSWSNTQRRSQRR